MLIHTGDIGQAQFLWDLRQNPKVVKVFQTLWDIENPEGLLTSFDGASIHLPPETTGKGWDTGKGWLHTDQSFIRNKFECVQSWVTAVNVKEGDATLAFLDGSHDCHEIVAKKFNITDKSDWYKLNDEELQFYAKLGCHLTHIKCPAGSMVLWDSRTIHSGKQPDKDRFAPNIRCVGYVCMLPRSLANETHLKKKKKAFEGLRTTSHYPVKIKMFPKTPRIYTKEQKAFFSQCIPIDPPVLTSLGKSLAGY